MNGEEKHRQNIQIYLQNGGSQKIADRHKTATLQNRAQIAYLIKDFPKHEAGSTKQEAVSTSKESQVNFQHPTSSKQHPTRKKLSFKEQRELETIEKEIPKLERRRETILAELNNETDYEKISKISDELQTVSDRLEEMEMRWLELQEITGN